MKCKSNRTLIKAPLIKRITNFKLTLKTRNFKNTKLVFRFFRAFVPSCLRGKQLLLATQYGHIPIKTHTPDVMNEPDLRAFHLDIAGLVTQLQYNRADLGPAGGADGMPL